MFGQVDCIPRRKTAATICTSYTMEPDLPPCLQECMPRSPASRRGRSPTPSTSRRLPRLSTSTAGEATKKSDNGDKKARAAQRAAQGRHLHLQGYQGCRQVQQERLQRSPTTATRRLVLPKDAIYIYKATKAVWTSTAGEATKKSDNGDKKARAAQRAAQGRHLHGYQGCRQVQQERLQRSPTTATRRLVLPREVPNDAKRAGQRS